MSVFLFDENLCLPSFELKKQEKSLTARPGEYGRGRGEVVNQFEP